MNSFLKSFTIFVLQISLFYNNIQNSYCMLLAKARIKSGNTALPNQFPWQASVTVYSNPETNNNNETETIKIQYCSGSIISNEWILTAAHCINNSNNITLGFDSYDFHNPKLTINDIKKYIIHPSYRSRTYRNDIALIQLKNPIKFTQNISSILLPTRSQSDISFEGVKSNISGWDEIQNSNNENSTILNPLKWAELTVISNAECATYYGSIITDSVICAQGSNGEKICGSDLGGPLIIHDERGQILIGIASFPQGCDNTKKPSGFTRTTSFLDWISKESGIEIS